MRGLNRRSAKQLESFLLRCEALLELISEHYWEVPETGKDYFTSVEGSLVEMQNWVEVNHHYTAKQLTALENWEQGVSRWVR